MSDSRNFVRNAVQNDSFGPDVLYAQGAYAAEGRPLFDYGMTATKEYSKLMVPYIANPPGHTLCCS